MEISNRLFGGLVTVLVFIGGMIAGTNGHAPWFYAFLSIVFLTVTLFRPEWLEQPKRVGVRLGTRLRSLKK